MEFSNANHGVHATGFCFSTGPGISWSSVEDGEEKNTVRRYRSWKREDFVPYSVAEIVQQLTTKRIGSDATPKIFLHTGAMDDLRQIYSFEEFAWSPEKLADRLTDLERQLLANPKLGTPTRHGDRMYLAMEATPIVGIYAIDTEADEILILGFLPTSIIIWA